MNNEENKSSSNTTPFNNKKDSNQRLGINEKLAKYTGMRQIRPRNNVDNSRLPLGSNHEPIDENKNAEETNNQGQNNSNQNNTSNKQENKKTRRNPFGPKNRLNNTALTLRDKLDTNPDVRDDIAKKGAEALKKSANPYAKAAGYAASYLQKRKEKKKKEEDKEENKDDNKSEDNDDNKNDNDDESSINVVNSKTRTRIIVRLVLIILPYVIGFIIILATIMPVLEAYSWFQSLFHHKSSNPDSYYIYNENQKEKLEQEIAFNDAIVGSSDGSKKGIIEEYKEKYGVTIDKCLLVAIITYRYSVIDTDEVYTDDGAEDITDEELENKAKELEEDTNDNTESNNTNESSIDFSSAKKKIKAVANIMIINEGNSYTTDHEVGGKVYNALIESKFLKDYYKNILKDDSYESRKKLVDEIFDYADGARLMDDEEPPSINGGVINGDTSVIHVQTCEQPYKYKDKSGIKVYNNTLWNEGTQYSDYLNMKDYLKGVLMGEVGGHIDSKYIEGLKAQTIAALSFLINDSKSGFDLKNGELYFPAGDCRQLTCSPTDGCTYLKGKTSGSFGTAFVGLNRYGNAGRQIKPLDDYKNSILEQVMNDVFGKIMVNKGVTAATFSGSKDTINARYLDSTSTGGFVTGKTFAQQQGMRDAQDGMNYEQILAKYYSGYDYDIIDITEGIYISGGFGNGEYDGTVVYYSQGDYSNVKFCGRDDATISSSGCGVTSAAIVASTFTGDKKYDPKYMMEWAYGEHECGENIKGTNAAFFRKFASSLGFGYESVGNSESDLQKVVEALKSGKSLVIGHMAGIFTSGSGHYIVLSKVNDKGEIYVNDPNSNKKTGFHSTNTLANNLKGEFHIITKK